ncbi:MAG: hypothetical protein HY698_02660 [Deltaproteobacteria bacterium]|nr:hypothetical protein [Deltaproteobacteria bacterium]
MASGRSIGSWLLLVVLGCGGRENTVENVDAQQESPPRADAAPEFACEESFGDTYVLNKLQFMDPGTGLDINDDAVPDNALGHLGQFVNKGLNDSIRKGTSLILLDLIQSGNELFIDYYLGRDWDADSTNNLLGQGEFSVTPEQFDVDCVPRGRFHSVTRKGREFTARNDKWTWVYPGFGTVEFRQVLVHFVFNDDASGFDGNLAGIWTLCGASNTQFSQMNIDNMSFLDAMVNNYSLQPDIDVDGDGIEEVVGDGVRVAKCLDGDGVVLEGRECPCLPQIADGFSVSFSGTGVRAKIRGVKPD